MLKIFDFIVISILLVLSLLIMFGPGIIEFTKGYNKDFAIFLFAVPLLGVALQYLYNEFYSSQDESFMFILFIVLLMWVIYAIIWLFRFL